MQLQSQASHPVCPLSMHGSAPPPLSHVFLSTTWYYTCLRGSHQWLCPLNAFQSPDSTDGIELICPSKLSLQLVLPPSSVTLLFYSQGFMLQTLCSFILIMVPCLFYFFCHFTFMHYECLSILIECVSSELQDDKNLHALAHIPLPPAAGAPDILCR